MKGTHENCLKSTIVQGPPRVMHPRTALTFEVDGVWEAMEARMVSKPVLIAQTSKFRE